MGHVATVKVQLKDIQCLEAVCGPLGIKIRTGPHEVQLYSGAIQAKASFMLPGWRYPVAVGEDFSWPDFVINGSRKFKVRRKNNKKGRFKTLAPHSRAWKRLANGKNGR